MYLRVQRVYLSRPQKCLAKIRDLIVMNINSSDRTLISETPLTRELSSKRLLQLMGTSAINSVPLTNGHEKIDKRNLKSAITGSSDASSCSSLVHVLPQVAATAATGERSRGQPATVLYSASWPCPRAHICLEHVEVVSVDPILQRPFT